uniref:Uncharacterized protein ycf18 n=1 Tax=Asparagopsis taxiformis TaxID=260499 RepID=A0A1C9CC84_9FLOR|nr:phycobilisome degradation protein [Asparagopsis taxiformis]AOM65954.1 phycobilisome degradation protein [Asparagopsis taxiformis]
MNKSNDLTLEQEFKLAIYTKKLYVLNNQEVKKHLINTLKQMMIKDNIIKYCIKHLTI